MRAAHPRGGGPAPASSPLRPVVVVPYDPRWPLYAAREARRLRSVLSPVAIHHIGSTAVPGLPAKPVLDLLVEARSLEELDAATPALRAVGYEARGEHGIAERRYFVRSPEGTPRVHVHCFVAGHARARRHLRLRDCLRRDPAAAAEYGALKQDLAARHPHDRDAYQAGKEALVEDLHRRARSRRRRPRGTDLAPEDSDAAVSSVQGGEP